MTSTEEQSGENKRPEESLSEAAKVTYDYIVKMLTAAKKPYNPAGFMARELSTASVALPSEEYSALEAALAQRLKATFPLAKKILDGKPNAEPFDGTSASDRGEGWARQMPREGQQHRSTIFDGGRNVPRKK